MILEILDTDKDHGTFLLRAINPTVTENSELTEELSKQNAQVRFCGEYRFVTVDSENYDTYVWHLQEVVRKFIPVEILAPVGLNLEQLKDFTKLCEDVGIAPKEQ
jgi:hypothetical protein